MGLEPGLEVLQSRVYYDPTTGDVVHVHSLAADPADQLGRSRIEEEMAVFEESLQERHQQQQLARITLSAEDSARYLRPGAMLRVDIGSGALVAGVANRTHPAAGVD